MDLNTEYIWLGIGFALIIAEVTMGNFILFFSGLAAAMTGSRSVVGPASRKRYPFHSVRRTRPGVACRRAFSPEAFTWLATRCRALLMKILSVRTSPS
jgi:hypothetical protein